MARPDADWTAPLVGAVQPPSPEPQAVLLAPLRCRLKDRRRHARRLETAEPDTPELVEAPELGVRRWDPLGWLKPHQPGGKPVPMS
jgi:hypothetical protein